jgi:predicted MPP superfamily phosphohydrolase
MVYSALVIECYSSILSTAPNARSADLALAGHTHAGQVYIPGFTTLLVHRLYSRFVAGTYVHRGVVLRVSRGLATVGVPARFLRRPEITIITVKSQ